MLFLVFVLGFLGDHFNKKCNEEKGKKNKEREKKERKRKETRKEIARAIIVFISKSCLAVWYLGEGGNSFTTAIPDWLVIPLR